MFLTISTTHSPATDLGYLLHKHPDRAQSFSLSFGEARVFYPEASENRCTAALLVDVDTIGLVRNRHTPRGAQRTLDHYVNDRPHAASSLLSVAISRVFSTAMNGTCKDRPQLAATPIPLEATIPALPARGGNALLRDLFEPIGYEVRTTRLSLDPHFPGWGDSPYSTITLRAMVRLSDLLTHLYVLIPVLDNDKHYWVGEDDVSKLLRHGEGWLSNHPHQKTIVNRYLKYQGRLTRAALAQLVEDEAVDPDAEAAEHDAEEESIERPISLNRHRIGAVVSALKASGARTVLDLGCGEGQLLRELMRERQFESIAGLDVSLRALEIAEERLRLERMPENQRQRISLLHGSLMYRDRRLEGSDAAAVVEVIEHLDPPRLRAFERVLFEFARPLTVVVTTPNREFNVMWESLPAGQFRHKDHRFEWTRAEFRE